ncbi:nitroreductase family deazaflavin-dependent oxidoreductase [Candidatus Poriferisodalis sp.]|uniref:nitroreductase family deazaflavin-dependent oxidoreductase n=1 Tax=Candidatus Poriferisodalis sp. TaxID=3101277 RepID=UPI003B5A1C23
MSMKGMEDGQVLSFNERIIAEFRENEGRCGGMFEGNPMLLLTMTGARSGRQLTSPLTYHELDGDWIVFASAGGHPSHPAWYHNVTANPAVTVEVGTESFAATAAELSGSERTKAFDAMCEAMPRFGEYQASVDREIPVIRLRRSI